MRLRWTTGKYSITYRAVKTVRINGKNKTQIVKSFGSEKYICETDGVTDAKSWAKEQVRQMNDAEKEDTAKFNIEKMRVNRVHEGVHHHGCITL